jgi:hypothetical protein
MTPRAGIRFVSLLVCLTLPAISAFGSESQHLPPIKPMAPIASSADIEAAVSLLCKPADITRLKNGGISGCKTCPKGTDFFGQNMGEWNLGKATVGHFTSANDTNLILGSFNCDSHAENFGGSFIFTMSSGKLKLMKYDQGLITDDCHKFPFADGRECLVCKGGWSGQGENDLSIFLAKFDATGKSTQTLIFGTSNSTGTCLDDPSTVVQNSDIQDIHFSTNESGTLVGMTVTALYGNISCAEASKKQSSGKLSASVRTYQIEFTFDGKQFVVAPNSRTTFNLFPRY